MCPVTLLFMGGGIVGDDVVRGGVSEGGGVGEGIYIGLYDGDLEGWLVVVVVVEVVGLSVVGCNDDDIGEFDGDEDDGSGVIGDLDGSDVGDLDGNIVGKDDDGWVVGGGEGGGVVGWGPIG